MEFFEARCVDAHNHPPEQREEAIVAILRQAADEMATGQLARATDLASEAVRRCTAHKFMSLASLRREPQPREREVPCSRCRRPTWNVSAVCDSCVPR
jgi:hypothetical protein